MGEIRHLDGRTRQHFPLLTDEGTPTGIGVWVPVPEPPKPRKRKRVGNVTWLWPVLWGCRS